MDIALWIVQILLVVVFGYSAAIKGTQTKERAVALGMTGVVNVPMPVVRFTAVCEVLGVLGLTVPYATSIAPMLTRLAAIGLGAIMIPAARIHLGLKEPATSLWQHRDLGCLRVRRCGALALVRSIANDRS